MSLLSTLTSRLFEETHRKKRHSPARAGSWPVMLRHNDVTSEEIMQEETHRLDVVRQRVQEVGLHHLQLLHRLRVNLDRRLRLEKINRSSILTQNTTITRRPTPPQSTPPAGANRQHKYQDTDNSQKSTDDRSGIHTQNTPITLRLHTKG